MELQQFNIEMLKKYEQVRHRNNDVLTRIAAYLYNCPTRITADLMQQMNPDGLINTAQAYAYLFAAICDVNPSHSEYDANLMSDYFLPSVRQLSANQFVKNPYYQNIRFPEVGTDNWEFLWVKYQPFEAFLCDDIMLLPDFREIPAVGFFDEEVSYPIVLQNKQEWMAVKPSEIATMQPVLDEISGNVFTFGLGLGYFAYMASQKREVDSVTIVERDPEVIGLFKQYILPQFAYSQKINIVQADAFDFLKQNFYKCKCNYLFVDLWHDVSDGLPLYVKMRAQEKEFPNVKFQYWIENSLQSALRWQLTEQENGFMNLKQ